MAVLKKDSRSLTIEEKHRAAAASITLHAQSLRPRNSEMVSCCVCILKISIERVITGLVVRFHAWLNMRIWLMVRLEVGAGICWCAGSGIAQQHVCLCVDLNMILRDNVAPPLGGERDGCSMLGVQMIIFKALDRSLMEPLVC